MSGKKNKQRRKRERGTAALAKAQRHEAEFIKVSEDGTDELWMRGKTAFVIPAIRDFYPPELKYAISRLRQADLTGTCECGASGRPGKNGSIVFGHEPDCVATWDHIIALFREMVRPWDDSWAVMLLDSEEDPNPHIMVFPHPVDIDQMRAEEVPPEVVVEIYPARNSPELMRMIKHAAMRDPDLGGIFLTDVPGSTGIVRELRQPTT